MSNFKIPRIRDAKYRASFKNAVCIACGSDYGVVGAHIRTGGEGGLGYKPDDSLILPLCVVCHARQENSPGPRWWVSNILDPHKLIETVKAMARQQYAEWKER